MANRTIDDAIVDVARFMSLVSAPGMTPYSDDAAVMFLRYAHEHIRDVSDWDEMTLWRTRTLDGVTGLITVLIDDTQDWKDIDRIYHESMQTPMAKLSTYANPLTSTLLFGYRGLDPASDNTIGDGRYLVQFYPATLQGQVLFQLARTIDFTDRDTVLPIDYSWHVFKAAHMWACQDGTNPVQIDNLAKLLHERENVVMSKENSRPVNAQPNQLMPNDWWEADAPYS